MAGEGNAAASAATTVAFNPRLAGIARGESPVALRADVQTPGEKVAANPLRRIASHLRHNAVPSGESGDGAEAQAGPPAKPEELPSDIHLKIQDMVEVYENPTAEYIPTQKTVDTMSGIMIDQITAFMHIAEADRTPYHSSLIEMFNNGQTKAFTTASTRDELAMRAKEILRTSGGFLAGKSAIEWEKIAYQQSTRAQVNLYGPEPTPLRGTSALMDHEGEHAQDERPTLSEWLARARRTLQVPLWRNSAVPVPHWENGRLTINRTVDDISLPVVDIGQGLDRSARSIRTNVRPSDFISTRNIRGHPIPLPDIRQGIGRSAQAVRDNVTRADFIRRQTIPGIQPQSRRIEVQHQIDQDQAQRDWNTRIKNVIALPDQATVQFAGDPATFDIALDAGQRLYLQQKRWTEGMVIPNDGRPDSLRSQIIDKLARITDAQIEIAVGTGRSEHDIASELNLVIVNPDGGRSFALGQRNRYYRNQQIGIDAAHTADLGVRDYSRSFQEHADREIIKTLTEVPTKPIGDVITARIEEAKQPRELTDVEKRRQEAANQELARANVDLELAEKGQGSAVKLTLIQAQRTNLDQVIGGELIRIYEHSLPGAETRINDLTVQLEVNKDLRKEVTNGIEAQNRIIANLGKDRSGVQISPTPETQTQLAALLARQTSLGEEYSRLTNQKLTAEANKRSYDRQLAEETINEAEGKNPNPKTYSALLKERAVLLNRERTLRAQGGAAGNLEQLRRNVANLTREIASFGESTELTKFRIEAYEAAETLFAQSDQVNSRAIFAGDREQLRGFDEAAIAPVHNNLAPAYARMMQVLGGQDILSKDRLADFKKLSLLFSQEDFLQIYNAQQPTAQAQIRDVYQDEFYNLGLNTINPQLARTVLRDIEARVRNGEVGLRDTIAPAGVLDPLERTHYQALSNLSYQDRSQITERPPVYERNGYPRMDAAGNMVVVTDDDIVSCEAGIPQYRDVYDLARILIAIDGNADYSNEATMVQWLRVADQVHERRQRIERGDLNISTRNRPSTLPIRPVRP